MSWPQGPSEIGIRDASGVFRGMRAPALMQKSHAVWAAVLAEHRDRRCTWRQAQA